MFAAFANDFGVDVDVLDAELAVAEPLRDYFGHVDRPADGHSPRLHDHLTCLGELDERAHGVAHDRLLPHEDVVGRRGPLHWCPHRLLHGLLCLLLHGLRRWLLRWLLLLWHGPRRSVSARWPAFLLPPCVGSFVWHLDVLVRDATPEAYLCVMKQNGSLP